MAADGTGSGGDGAARLVAQARRDREERERGYRERALKLFPHICGRCGREFEGKRLRDLTVHHRDGNHDRNPPDGSNWELLCVYCHDNEHQRSVEYGIRGGEDGAIDTTPRLTQRPFANLADLLKDKVRK